MIHSNFHQGYILAVGAHPDDIELGCGATLSRHKDEGIHVVAAVMTAGRKGTDSNKYNREEETRRALAHLGVQSVFCFDFDDTLLGHQLDGLITSLECVMMNKIPAGTSFSRVYTMCPSDRHQDHRAVYHATIVACRTVGQILTYETPSSWSFFQPNVFSDIAYHHLDNKLRAIREHKSQQHRIYMQPDQIRSVARFRGLQAGCEMVEAFAVHKMVI
ncbi:PIG-L family deacetylase [Salmonella enterica]|nr:PIG-L family deacetylase [Salmonella enterica]EBM4432375.1 PIG-L family deacetylase [Salmonella enterica]EDV7107519.1 PIG-L family deacetylase [Salmonella enterica subsp. enterica]